MLILCMLIYRYLLINIVNLLKIEFCSIIYVNFVERGNKMIKNVVFDLDGTLWQTQLSYIYAYQRLCEKYNKTPLNSFNEVLKYMGVKVDVLLKELFPEVTDQRLIIKEALTFSIEYIIKNPEGTCFEGVYNVLETLSKEYNIYIISNCLKEYVETFLEISKTKEFVKDFYTIELGEKKEHLKKITNSYQDKTVFIGDDIEDYNQIINHKCIFFIYAKYGYKECNEYDYYINNLHDLFNVLKTINNKERILNKFEYEVISNNDTNVTLIKKNEELYYFGFVNVLNYDDLDVVIQKIKNKCEAQKKNVLGPIDGNTFYTYRFALDNFDWVLYPDLRNTKETVDVFLKSGFEIKQVYSSTLANINEKFYQRSKKCKLSSDYKVVIVEGKDCYNYVGELYDVTINAFKKADYYEEISKDDFIDMYLENLKLCSPDLVLIYYKDKLIAFHFCYEDLEKRFYVSKTIAIHEDFRNKTVLMKLIDLSYSLMIKKGYRQVLHHFQNDRTKTLQAIHKGCSIKTKHFGLFEYKTKKV